MLIMGVDGATADHNPIDFGNHKVVDLLLEPITRTPDQGASLFQWSNDLHNVAHVGKYCCSHRMTLFFYQLSPGTFCGEQFLQQAAVLHVGDLMGLRYPGSNSPGHCQIALG